MKLSLKVLALWACVLAVSAQEVSTPPNQSPAPAGTSDTLPSASQPSASSDAPTSASQPSASSVAPTSASVSAPSSVSASATSSSAAATGSNLSDCLNADPNTSTSFFANSKLTDGLQNTTGFSVTYSNVYKVVTNKLTNENYILYCTRTQPNLTNIQAKTYIHIPVTKLAVVDTRALGYLGLLNQNDIVYVGNSSNLTSPCVSSKPAQYNISDPSFSQSAYDLVVFPDSGGNDPNGISFGLTYQATPLALAEWIKYFSLFTNQETVAEQIFNKIKQSYETARDSINGADISYKRNITFMQYFPDSTKFNVFEDMYFKNISSDAGGNLTTSLISQPGDPSTLRAQVTNSSIVVDFTALIAPNNTFDYWNNWIGYVQPNLTNAANTALDNAKQHGGLYLNDPQAPPFERFNQLWRVDKSVSAAGADDFYSRGLARPDLVLQDLILAQYPDYPGGYKRTFLRNLAANEPTATTNGDSYGCGLATNLAIASKQSYSNHTVDSPMITFSGGLSLPAIIGLSIGGGLIAIACIAASAVTISKKIKNRKRFTRLTDVGGEAFDMPRQSHAEESALYGPHDDFEEDLPTGRYGGSGRQMS